MKLLSPITFNISEVKPELIKTGWRLVALSPCGRFYDVQSKMKQRRIRKPSGKIVSVLSYHIYFTNEAGGTGIMGPFESSMSRAEIIKSADDFYLDMGLSVDFFVFHADLYEFGCMHSSFSKDEIELTLGRG